MAMEAVEFRRLVETHQRMVFSLALRVTGEYGTAEEVAQDAFLELYRAVETLESDDHVRFWLRRVTVHRATDALRRRAVRPEAAARSGSKKRTARRLRTVLGSQWDECGCGGAAGGVVAGAAGGDAVAVVLRYQEEMSPDEIAKLLGQPVATVKSHLQRGLQLLRRKAAVTMKEYVR